MSLVSKGQGRDGDAAALLVSGGLGTTAPAEVDPNALVASLSGTSAVTATLTAAGQGPTATAGGGRPLVWQDDFLTIARLDDDLLLV